MKPGQFSIRDLLLSILLIAVGLWCVTLVEAKPSWILLGAGMLIGAGLFAPFRRPGLGAVLGLACVPLACTLLPFKRASLPPAPITAPPPATANAS